MGPENWILCLPDDALPGKNVGYLNIFYLRKLISLSSMIHLAVETYFERFTG